MVNPSLTPGLISPRRVTFANALRSFEGGVERKLCPTKFGANSCDMVVQLLLGRSIYLGWLGVRSPPLPAGR